MPNNPINLEIRLSRQGLAADVAAAKAQVASIDRVAPVIAVSADIKSAQSAIKQLEVEPATKVIRADVSQAQTAIKQLGVEPATKVIRADVSQAQAAIDGIAAPKPLALSVDNRGAIAGIAEIQTATQDLSASLAAIGATAYFANLQRDILNTGKMFEDLQATLETTLGSPEAAQAAINEISDFAAKTPFQVEQVQQAFISLSQRGISPTTENLRKLGDLASSQGKPLQQIVEAILDASTREFERLKEFGIRASQQGDKVSLSFKGVQKTVEATPQSISSAIIAFGELEGVAGGMERRSRTLSGQLSNLEDNSSRLKASMAGLVQGPLTQGIATLNSLFDASSAIPEPLRISAAAVALLASGFVTATAAVAAYNFAGGAATVATVQSSAATVANTASKAANAVVTGSLTAATGVYSEALKVQSAIVAGNTAALAAQAQGLGVVAATAATAAAPFLILAAAVGAATVNFKAQDLQRFNESIDEQTASLDGLSNEAFRYAKTLKDLQSKQSEGTPLTEQEAKAQVFYKGQLQAVVKELEARANAVKLAKPANEDQARSQALVAAQLDATIGVLKGVLDGTQALDAATKKYNKTLETLAQQAKASQIAIKEAFAAGNISSVELDRRASQQQAQDLQAQQAAISQRIAALKSSRAQAKDTSQVDQQIKEAEGQQLDVRGQLADLGVAARRKQLQEQQQAEQQAQQQAQSRIDLIQSRQQQAVQARQLAGQISERQAQAAILQVQQEASQRSIALKQNEIARIQQLQASGQISPDESVARQAATAVEMARIQEQIQSRQLQAQKQALTEAAQIRALEVQGRSAQIEISQSEAQRAVKDQQTQGQISERQAQAAILQIQRDGTAQQLALKFQQLAQNKRLNDLKLISDQEAAQAQVALSREAEQLLSAQAEQRAQREQQRQQAQAEQIQRQGQVAVRPLRAQGDRLESGSRIDSVQSQLAQVQGDVEQRRLDLQRQRLEFAQQEYQQNGQTAQAEAVRAQLIALQNQQLALQEKIATKRLDIELKQLDIDLKRREIAAQIALIDAKTALDSAIAIKADPEKINDLKQSLQLRKDALASLGQEKGVVEDIKKARKDALAIEQEINRERQAKGSQPATSTAPVEVAKPSGISSQGQREQLQAASQAFDRATRTTEAERNVGITPQVDAVSLRRLVTEAQVQRDNPFFSSKLAELGQPLSDAITRLSNLPTTQVNSLIAQVSAGSRDTNQLLQRINESLQRLGGPRNLYVSSPNPVQDAASIYQNLSRYGGGG